MTVDALISFDPQQFFNLRSTSELPAHRLDTRVSTAAVLNDFFGRVSITTAEGDRVTFSADLQSDFRAVNYRSYVQADRAAVDVEAEDVRYALSREFGMTVDGDLNEQEQQDLGRLFHKVTSIFRNFFQGQDEEGLVHTAKLAERFGGLSSLSSLDLSVDVERSLTVLAPQVASEVSGQSASSTERSAASLTDS